MNNVFKSEYLIIGNTFEGVQRAIQLAKQGSKVMLAAEEAYLAVDFCGTGCYERNESMDAFFPEECRMGDYYHPDQCKKYLETMCLEAGVSFYYGLFYLDGETRVRLAGKGGIYTIYCNKTEWYQIKKGTGKLSLAAWVTEKAAGRNRLIRAFVSDQVNCGLADRLLSVREQLLCIFAGEKKQCPDLLLGRFADRAQNVEEQSGTAAGENHSNQRNFSENGYFEKQIVEKAQVIVAGGGTAGAMAALYAARGGAKTVLIEPQYDLGGTGTLGGVNAYWFGTRFADVKEIDEEVDRLCGLYGIERKEGIFDRYDAFHAGIKGMVLLRLCLEAGVRVVFGQLAYDVVKEGSRVTGVATTGREGKKIFCGSIIIDATGDADLAAAAGAGWVYGSERDSITYWASLAQYTGTDSYENNFASMVRVDDPQDMTRFIRIGRLRGQNTFDHGSYVSVRESRHIKGKTTLDLRDICLFRTYDDGLYTCFSNYDPKGKTDADMINCGFLPPQVKIQVPLSALLPTDQAGRQIQGLYVAGKAISATHNAFPSLRMQPDLMHQGAVLGLLCARAVKAGDFVETLKTADRRRWISEATGDDLTLPENNHSVTIEETVAQIKAGSRTHWIDVPFTYEVKEKSPVLAVLCEESSHALPALQERIRDLEEQKNQKQEGKSDSHDILLLLKRIALFHGCDAYTREIEEDILEKLEAAGSFLPMRAGSVMCAQLLPDHGVMPELVYELSTLAFGRSFSMKPFEIVTERLTENKRDYLCIEQGIFPYMESIAYVAERSGRREFIPLLKKLSAFPEFTWAVKEENQVELLAERLQILLFLLLRALFRLSPEEGTLGLLGLRSSYSKTISKSAEMALQERRESNGREKAALYDRKFTY